MKYRMTSEVEASNESIGLIALGATVLGLAVAGIWKANKPLSRLNECINILRRVSSSTQDIDKRMRDYKLEGYDANHLLTFVKKLSQFFTHMHKFKPQNIVKSNTVELCKLINDATQVSNADYAKVGKNDAIDYNKWDKIWMLEKATYSELHYNYTVLKQIIEAMTTLYKYIEDSNKLAKEYNAFIQSKEYLEMDARDQAKVNKAKYAVFAFISDMHRNVKPRLSDITSICSRISFIYKWSILEQDSARDSKSDTSNDMTEDDVFDMFEIDFDSYVDACRNAGQGARNIKVKVTPVKELDKWFKEFIKFAKFVKNLRPAKPNEDFGAYCKAIDKELKSLNLTYLSSSIKCSDIDEDDLQCDEIGILPIGDPNKNITLQESGWLAHASVKNLFKQWAAACSISYVLDEIWNENETAEKIHDKVQAHLACSVYEYFGEALLYPDLADMLQKVESALM